MERTLTSSGYRLKRSSVKDTKMLFSLWVITLAFQPVAGSKSVCSQSVFEGQTARIDYVIGQNIADVAPLLLFVMKQGTSGDILRYSRVDMTSKAECNVRQDLFRCDMKKDTLSLIISRATVDMQGTYELHVIHNGTADPAVSCTLVVNSPQGAEPEGKDPGVFIGIGFGAAALVILMITALILLKFKSFNNAKEKDANKNNDDPDQLIETEAKTTSAEKKERAAPDVSEHPKGVLAYIIGCLWSLSFLPVKTSTHRRTHVLTLRSRTTKYASSGQSRETGDLDLLRGVRESSIPETKIGHTQVTAAVDVYDTHQGQRAEDKKGHVSREADSVGQMTEPESLTCPNPQPLLTETGNTKALTKTADNVSRPLVGVLSASPPEVQVRLAQEVAILPMAASPWRSRLNRGTSVESMKNAPSPAPAEALLRLSQTGEAFRGEHTTSGSTALTFNKLALSSRTSEHHNKSPLLEHGRLLQDKQLFPDPCPDVFH